MFSKCDAVHKTDVRKIAIAFMAVLAMVFATFAIVNSDNSDAVPADVDGKHYFYDQLSPKAKELYDAALNNYEISVGENEKTHEDSLITTITLRLSAEAPFDESVKTEYKNAFNEIVPIISNELVTQFWLGNSWKFTAEKVDSIPTMKMISYSNVLTFGTTTAQINTKLAQLMQAIENVPLEDLTSRFTTVQSIHKVVCNMLTYDGTKADGAANRNIAQAFLGNNTVVCEGYAKSFKALCDAYLVPCIIVTEDGVVMEGGELTSEGHMWNYVQMEDGKWYLVDCTWDDQSTLNTT